MNIEIEIDQYPQLRHAIATLEAERIRLTKSIRELSWQSVKRRNDPNARAGELRLCLDEIKTGISLMHNCVEAARYARQREYPPSKQKSNKRKAKASRVIKPKDAVLEASGKRK